MMEYFTFFYPNLFSFIYFYFVDGKNEDGRESGLYSFLGNDISYNEKEVCRIESYEVSFRNPKLKYFFWGGTTTYSKLILSRKENVF